MEVYLILSVLAILIVLIVWLSYSTPVKQPDPQIIKKPDSSTIKKPDSQINGMPVYKPPEPEAVITPPQLFMKRLDTDGKTILLFPFDYASKGVYRNTQDKHSVFYVKKINSHKYAIPASDAGFGIVNIGWNSILKKQIINQTEETDRMLLIKSIKCVPEYVPEYTSKVSGDQIPSSIIPQCDSQDSGNRVETIYPTEMTEAKPPYPTEITVQFPDYPVDAPPTIKSLTLKYGVDGLYYDNITKSLPTTVYYVKEVGSHKYAIKGHIRNDIVNPPIIYTSWINYTEPIGPNSKDPNYLLYAKLALKHGIICVDRNTPVFKGQIEGDEPDLSLYPVC